MLSGEIKHVMDTRGKFMHAFTGCDDTGVSWYPDTPRFGQGDVPQWQNTP